MSSSYEDLLFMLKEKLHNDSFKSRHITAPHLFSRSRMLTFPRMLVAQINRMSKSLSVEVSRFFSLLGGKVSLDPTKQAFSKARRGLKASAFVELNEDLIRGYYAQGVEVPSHGYLLLGIDGSLLQLPNRRELLSDFGACPGGRVPMAMARVSRLFDLRHRMVLDSQIDRYDQSEQFLAYKHIEKLSDLLGADYSPLIISDRNYPSFAWCAYLQSKGIDFLIRVPTNFSKELRDFAQSSSEDQTLSIDLLTKSAKVKRELEALPAEARYLDLRMLKVALDSGEIEYLITSVMDQKRISTQDFKNLYHQRWGCETDYDYAKNALQIENFSARKTEAIKQEFQAITLTQNIANLLIEEAQKQLDQEATHSKNFHQYQVNRAVAFGLIKDQLPYIFFGEESIQSLTQRLIQKIKRRKNPRKPNRSFERKWKTKHKFHDNKRPVI